MGAVKWFHQVKYHIKMPTGSPILLSLEFIFSQSLTWNSLMSLVWGSPHYHPPVQGIKPNIESVRTQHCQHLHLVQLGSGLGTSQTQKLPCLSETILVLLTSLCLSHSSSNQYVPNACNVHFVASDIIRSTRVAQSCGWTQALWRLSPSDLSPPAPTHTPRKVKGTVQ